MRRQVGLIASRDNTAGLCLFTSYTVVDLMGADLLGSNHYNDLQGSSYIINETLPWIYLFDKYLTSRLKISTVLLQTNPASNGHETCHS